MSPKESSNRLLMLTYNPGLFAASTLKTLNPEIGDLVWLPGALTAYNKVSSDLYRP